VEGLDAFAKPGDDPRDLMAENHRFLQAHGAEAAVVEIVEIGAANAAAQEADRHFAGVWRFKGAFLQAQVFRGICVECFHRSPSSPMAPGCTPVEMVYHFVENEVRAAAMSTAGEREFHETV